MAEALRAGDHQGARPAETAGNARGRTGASSRPGSGARQSGVRSATRWDLGSDHVLGNFLSFVTQMRLAGKRPIVEVIPERRSLDQNSMIYALYQQIADQSEEKIVDIRRECKLRYGVPILRAGSDEFRYVYDRAIKPLEYEFKLRAMDWLPVTSRMSKAQATEFIDSVIREYSERGLSLVHPSEVYGEA